MALDLVQIGFKIQADGLQEANVALDKLLNKAKKPLSVKVDAKGVDDAAKATSRAVKETEMLQRKLELVKKGYSNITAGGIARFENAKVPQNVINSYIETRKELDNLNKARLKFSSQRGFDISAAIGIGFGAAVVGQLVKQFIGLADTMTLLESRTKLVTPATTSLVQVQKDLLDIANENRVSLLDTTTLYTRLVPALNRVGAGYKEAIGVTDAFGKALLVGGANAREASAAILQFSQAMASGKLAGDKRICHPTE